ncbi:uncharacterized protein [Halyomorpha halys]|uniref:uncharacterized protein n=1 Tax=Halyomorpha halys TaxID=286706 RepID=UPI0006D4E996|nr:uncharacterized protein LOC106681956 [Halyomorpha halys]
MAVRIEKSDRNNIPEGAVLISKEKALDMQWKALNNWIPRSDLFFFRYGPGILAASSVVSSTLVMQHYRNKLKLLNIGRGIMFVPGVVFPALMILPFYVKAVQQPIVLQDHCPICIQMRSVTIQSMISIPYPILVSTVGSFLMASTYGTYRMPEFSLFPIKKLGEYLSFWKQVSKRLIGNLPMHFLLQFTVAILITELTAKEVFKVQAQLEFQDNSSS